MHFYIPQQFNSCLTLEHTDITQYHNELHIYFPETFTFIIYVIVVVIFHYNK